MNQNLKTLGKITLATTITLSLLSVPYRWHKGRAHPFTPTSSARTVDFQLLSDTTDDESLNSIATDISNRGDIVGVAFDATGETVQAFHVKDRRLHFLPSPKGVDMAFAQAVNDRGLVVGAAISGKAMRPIAWNDGKGQVLDSLGAEAVAAGVSEKGQIAGTGQPAEGKLLGLVWEKGGKPRKLGEFGINGVSDNGWMVGARIKNDTFQAVAYFDQKLYALPMPSGAAAAAAQASDGKNRIVGAALVGDAIRAVLWTRDKSTVLEGLSAGRAFATDVNHAGDIVGASDAGDGQMSATLWRNGKPIDLNTRLPEGSGWRAVMASGINSNGMVVGWAVKGDRVSGFALGPIR